MGQARENQHTGGEASRKEDVDVLRQGRGAGSEIVFTILFQIQTVTTQAYSLSVCPTI